MIHHIPPPVLPSANFNINPINPVYFAYPLTVSMFSKQIKPTHFPNLNYTKIYKVHLLNCASWHFVFNVDVLVKYLREPILLHRYIHDITQTTLCR